jgi:hypothetical protein
LLAKPLPNLVYASCLGKLQPAQRFLQIFVQYGFAAKHQVGLALRLFSFKKGCKACFAVSQ